MQKYFFILFVGLDDFLLVMMAYDRFVAICRPLHYLVIMNPQLCVQLVWVFWVISVLKSLSHSLLVLWLSFCTRLEIPHFFCELNQVNQVACSDTLFNDFILYFASVLLVGGPLGGILYSCSRIVSSVCAISSTRRKYKSFPPVPLTSPLSLYFIVLDWEFTLALLLPKTHALLQQPQ